MPSPLPLGFPLATTDRLDRRALVEHWHQQLTGVPAENKLTSLGDALRTHVLPGSSVYLGGSLSRPNAAAFELVRQFHDSDPRLTVIAPALANQHAVLVHCGLVAKAISSLHGNTYPGPGPNRVFTEADLSGAVEFEDWSLLTLVLRLYAAATNVPFLPTRSLVGSDLGRDLAARGLIRFEQDSDGDEIACVSPLHPDVTVVHALLADTAGNAVFSPPFYEDVWAAFAAKRAVVVTAERIVPTGAIRRYAQYVRVPAAYVTAVCEVPFGGHPNQLPGELVTEVDGYLDDYAFLAEIREVSRDSAAFDAWVKQWVLGVQDHQEYLALLGSERLDRLRAATDARGWQEELALLETRWDAPASAAEVNAILGARHLHRLVVERDYRSALAGVGVSTLAAWLAGASLHSAGVAFDLLAEGGMYGYTPLPLDPYLFNYRNLFTSTSLSNVQTILDVVVGGNASRAVGVLGAAQVDSRGAINTTRVRGRKVTGSGGGNDIASTAAAVVVTTVQSPQRLPESVEFVTSPGSRVQAIVTDRAVLERSTDTGRFVLTSVVDLGTGVSTEDLVRDAVGLCGWDLEVAPAVELQPAVTGTELAALRTYDPTGNFVL